MTTKRCTLISPKCQLPFASIAKVTCNNIVNTTKMPNVPKRKQRPWLQGSQQQSKERLQRNKFYHSTAWRKLRTTFIKQHPLCVECDGVGQVIDHIVPIKQGGESLAWENLQTMCHRCHNIKSGKEAHQ